MAHRPIVFLDVETTGLSACDGHVLEIGAVRVEKGKVVAKFSQLLDPGLEVPWYITKITGIKTEDLRGAPGFNEIAPKLDQLMEGAIFAAHSVDFDYSFLTEEYKRIGQKLRFDRFCTAKLSRQLNPEHRRHGLDSIIERGNYQVKNRHRAYDDAYVLYEFFRDRLQEHGYDLFKYIEQIMVTTPNLKIDNRLQYIPFFD